MHRVRSGKKLRFQWFSAGTPLYRVTLRVDKGASRVLLDKTTATSVTVKVRHKHRYSFSVDALDATGAVTATTAFSYRA